MVRIAGWMRASVALVSAAAASMTLSGTDKRLGERDVRGKAVRHARLHPPRYTFELGHEACQTLRRILRARRRLTEAERRSAPRLS